jgi:hypothetical protein
MIIEELISPTYSKSFSLDTVENKIAVFKDHVKGWQLDIANDLICMNHRAGYATMHILLSYIEMIGAYLQGAIFENGNRFVSVQPSGRKRVKFFESFLEGIIFTFPELSQHDPNRQNEIAKLFYYKLRCALYHYGMVADQVLLTTEITQPYVIQSNPDGTDTLIINPKSFAKHLIESFSAYIELVSDINNDEKRKKFVYSFDNNGF